MIPHPPSSPSPTSLKAIINFLSQPKQNRPARILKEKISFFNQLEYLQKRFSFTADRLVYVYMEVARGAELVKVKKGKRIEIEREAYSYTLLEGKVNLYEKKNFENDEVELFKNTQVEPSPRVVFQQRIDLGQSFGKNTKLYDMTHANIISDCCLLRVSFSEVERIKNHYMNKYTKSIDLKSLEPFENLSLKSISQLESLCSELKTRHNQELIKQNTSPKHIYLIQNGEFELIKTLQAPQKSPAPSDPSPQQLHNMSVLSRRDHHRQSIFQKLSITHNKSQYSKHPLCLFSTGKILCLEGLFGAHKVRYSVICKSFEGILYKIDIGDLEALLGKNNEIKEVFKREVERYEENLERKLGDLSQPILSRNQTGFMKAIKSNTKTSNAYMNILRDITNLKKGGMKERSQIGKIEKMDVGNMSLENTISVMRDSRDKKSCKRDRKLAKMDLFCLSGDPKDYLLKSAKNPRNTSQKKSRTMRTK